jgi:exosortase C (VPDSG-CTERM-specific)
LVSVIEIEHMPAKPVGPLRFLEEKKTMTNETAPYASAQKGQLRKFALAVVALVAVFGFPLLKLADFALHDEFVSFILLIPFTSFYLAWLLKEKLPAVSLPEKKWAAVFFAGGLASVAGYFLKPGSTVADNLAPVILAFVLCVTGAGFLFLGGTIMRILAFPFSLLVFMIPFPDVMRLAIETWLQHWSAAAAGWMFALSGMTVFHEGLVFHLPDITIQVAPECSGIQSSIVLLIVSLVAGHLFLRQPAKRALLCLAVIPLAVLRNGFRVFTLGELCTHIGPEMIDSPIHHRGGPIFFALSLIPFSLLLYFLMKSERSKNPGPPVPSN